jgi:hypothetical protein
MTKQEMNRELTLAKRQLKMNEWGMCARSLETVRVECFKRSHEDHAKRAVSNVRIKQIAQDGYAVYMGGMMRGSKAVMSRDEATELSDRLMRDYGGALVEVPW